MKPLVKELKELGIPPVDLETEHDPVFKGKITIDMPGYEKWEWYIAEIDDDGQCLGYVIGLFNDLGYFYIDEIFYTANYDLTKINIEKVDYTLKDLNKK